MSKFVYLIVVPILVSNLVLAGPWDHRFNTSPFNKSYYLLQGEFTFVFARKVCEHMSARLVLPMSLEEEQHLLVNYGMYQFWINAVRTVYLLDFTTTNHTNLVYNKLSSGKLDIRCNFCCGLTIMPNETWSAQPCFEKYRVICERDASPKNVNDTEFISMAKSFRQLKIFCAIISAMLFVVITGFAYIVVTKRSMV